MLLIQFVILKGVNISVFYCATVMLIYESINENELKQYRINQVDTQAKILTSAQKNPIHALFVMTLYYGQS